MLDKLAVKLLTLKMWLSDERGQDVVEYGLLAGFIGLALAAAFLLFTPLMDNFASAIANCVDITANPYACP